MSKNKNQSESFEIICYEIDETVKKTPHKNYFWNMLNTVFNLNI